MSLIPLFVSGAFHQALPLKNKKKFNQELIKECYALKKMDSQGLAWSKNHYLGGYTSYSSYSNLHTWSSSFQTLESKINPFAQQFLESLGYDTKNKNIQMTSFWVNIMGHQTTHSWHIHPRSVVSGSYYVQIPKDSVGIKFEDPRMNSMMCCLPKKRTLARELQNFVSLKPKAGELILFESWLRHEVPPNPSHTDRISVSFNYEWID